MAAVAIGPGAAEAEAKTEEVAERKEGSDALGRTEGSRATAEVAEAQEAGA